MASFGERLRRLLPGVWLGMLAGVALVAAPASFAVLARTQAGLVNGRIFRIEAGASIVLALVLWFLERARAQRAAREGRGSRLSTEMVLVLAVLFCTILSAYGLQPMIEAARGGHAVPLGFGVLHGGSVALFGLKALLVAALAWRASGTREGA
ncbi:MAG: DUF4149 domain-containing protein [Burkholderiales bacterium]|nr:DUF4149 domain-containing protein [Burkholderiales bacterium]